LIVHVGKVESGSFHAGDTVHLTVDARLRKDTEIHHSATHILHAVLRKVLGDHVKQAGSLVAPDRLRFDFTHFSALTSEEITQVERLVNDEIRQNQHFNVRVMGLEEALKTGLWRFLKKNMETASGWLKFLASAASFAVVRTRTGLETWGLRNHPGNQHRRRSP